MGHRERPAQPRHGRAEAVAAARAQPEWVARLCGAAEALRAAIGAPLPPIDRAEYDRVVDAARATLREAAFAGALASGRALTPEQAVAYALDGAAPAPT